jgi:hypothetical protein
MSIDSIAFNDGFTLADLFVEEKPSPELKRVREFIKNEKKDLLETPADVRTSSPGYTPSSRTRHVTLGTELRQSRTVESAAPNPAAQKTAEIALDHLQQE